MRGVHTRKQSMSVLVKSPVIIRILSVAMGLIGVVALGWAADPLIVTVAGNGTPGSSGDGGSATAATLYVPSGIARDSAGNLYIADSSNHRIRKVTASTGIISTVAGTGSFGFNGDGGAATAAALYNPTGVTVDGSGNLYVADSYNYRIRKVTVATGIITTVAGSGAGGYSGDGGAATAAAFNLPNSLVVDGSGNLYIADYYNQRIRKVTAATGVVTTVAGNGNAGFAGDGAAATSAQLYYPSGVAVDSGGNVLIADRNNHRVRKVTVATGIITTVAGNGAAGSAGDGAAATSANLYYPNGVAVDSTGAIFIADQGNNKIRKVSSGTITTVAGDGTSAFAGDGGSALLASLSQPTGVIVTSAGALFIADQQNHRIRQVATGPVVLTSAKATPAPVVGTTTNVSALGADSAYAETSLTYTWATSGTPPAAVTFSPNTSNAAKVSTATFTKIGTYTLQVTIKDPANATVVSPIVVTVVQTPTGLAVTPATKSSGLNSPTTFTATPSGTDQFGAALVGPYAISWTVTGGGSISSTGVFTSGNLPSGPHTVTATMGNRSATAAVTVVNQAPTIATAAAGTPNPTVATTTTLSALGADDGGEANLTYTWQTTGTPPAPVIYSVTGTNAAKSTSAIFTKAGIYTFQVTIVDSFGLSATSTTAAVTVSPAFTGATITPVEVVMNPGAARTFTAQGLDQFGQALGSQPTFIWSTSGGGTMVSSTGALTALTTAGGPYTITAQSGSVYKTTTFTIGWSNPIAQTQSLALSKNAAQAIILTATDANLDVLTYTIVAPPAHGTLTGIPPNLTFQPTNGYLGADQFTFKANDGHADSNVAIISLSMHDVQEPVTTSLTPLSAPAPFDNYRWTNDVAYRTVYLQGSEPGRVWQSAAPGAGVSVLRPNGTTSFTTPGGTTLSLSVLAAPNVPVSWTCFGEGTFAITNQKTITVLADAAGQASVSFQCSDGGRIPILVASPLCSGSVRLLVTATPLSYLIPTPTP